MKRDRQIGSCYGCTKRQGYKSLPVVMDDTATAHFSPLEHVRLVTPGRIPAPAPMWPRPAAEVTVLRSRREKRLACTRAERKKERGWFGRSPFSSANKLLRQRGHERLAYRGKNEAGIAFSRERRSSSFLKHIIISKNASVLSRSTPGSITRLQEACLAVSRRNKNPSPTSSSRSTRIFKNAPFNPYLNRWSRRGRLAVCREETPAPRSPTAIPAPGPRRPAARLVIAPEL